MRIKLDTPEEIAKWREERKRFEQRLNIYFLRDWERSSNFPSLLSINFLNKIYCFYWAQTSPMGRAQMEPIGPVSKMPS